MLFTRTWLRATKRHLPCAIKDKQAAGLDLPAPKGWKDEMTQMVGCSHVYLSANSHPSN